MDFCTALCHLKRDQLSGNDELSGLMSIISQAESKFRSCFDLWRYHLKTDNNTLNSGRLFRSNFPSPGNTRNENRIFISTTFPKQNITWTHHNINDRYDFYFDTKLSVRYCKQTNSMFTPFSLCGHLNCHGHQDILRLSHVDRIFVIRYFSDS